tara:strand:+ start:3425 stop:4201 length:777 start_codon:yes stop_codon:yes gene_type:complete
MNIQSLQKRGYSKIILDSKIINYLKKDILKILYKKILNKKILIQDNKINELYKSLNKSINTLEQDIFLQKFGDVSLRYCSYPIGQTFNKHIKEVVKKKLKYNQFSLPYPMRYQLKENKSLKKNQFCIYFRCVRSKKNDVGNIHRDVDFWNIEKPVIPKKVKKFKKVYKIWVPIFGCNKNNSLNILEKSHSYNFKIKYKKNRFLKPIINEKEANKFKKIVPIKNFKNQAVLFDYNTAHFAPVNKSKYYRVSAEFSLICK